MKSYIKDYPRPQLVRSAWENLNGKWDFAFDESNKGEKEEWFKQFVKETEIIVPFTYETKLSGIEDETIHDYIWYHKTVSIEENDLKNTRIVLNFEGSDYTTKVWVNGQFIGVHTGGYSRFSFDITESSKVGDNNITVKVEDSLNEEQPRGKQRWKSSNFGCWYVQTTGIWKTVWLEYVPVKHVEDLKMTPLLSQRALAIELDVISDTYGPEILLEVEITFGDLCINKMMLPVMQKHMSTQLSIYSTKVDEWGIKTWTPEHPNLYDIKISIIHNGSNCDTVYSYFGMRDINIDGQNILLNGTPLYQRLILDQGYWKDSHLTPPNEEALIEDINKILELGYNGVRKHQKVEDERFLYWCDVKGLLVWSEVGASYRFSNYAVEEFTKQWMNIVKQNYNHPSIITWTPFNESWGIESVATHKAQQHFTEAIYHLTKAFDEMRPVIVNDGWEHTISDIITLHDYEEKGSIFFERYAHLKENMADRQVYYNQFKSALAQGYSYKGQPIIISEFGGIAFNNDDRGWGYGNKVQTKEEFIKRFEEITMVIKKLPFICGYCYTQVTDVQQEINGLMDITRNFKVDPSIIREINEK